MKLTISEERYVAADALVAPPCSCSCGCGCGCGCPVSAEFGWKILGLKLSLSVVVSAARDADETVGVLEGSAGAAAAGGGGGGGTPSAIIDTAGVCLAVLRPRPRSPISRTTPSSRFSKATRAAHCPKTDSGAWYPVLNRASP